MGIAPNLPGAGLPPGSYTGSTAGGLQDITEQTVKDAAYAPIIDTFGGSGGVLALFANLWNGFTSLLDFLQNIVLALTGGGSGNPGDLLDFLGDWSSGLSGLITNVSNLVQSILGTLTGIPGADIDDLGDWAGSVITDLSAAIDAATSAAVDTISNAFEELISGNIVTDLAGMILQAINDAIASVFGGSDGVKWGQEVLAASGPVTTGLNDIPLGFGMPFPGRITDFYLVTSEHLSTGSGTGATILVKKNGTTIQTITWTGGTNTRTLTGLNLTVAKGDRITFDVSAITSQMANLSVMVTGKYA